MQICKNCLLPESYPKLRFDDNGICNICNEYNFKKESKYDFGKLKGRLKNEFNKHKNKGTYDCLVLFSGGKDSTYMLYTLMKEFNLKILAFTFDNGFLSKQTFMNINNTLNQLNVDHVYFKPQYSIMKDIFKLGIESCINPEFKPYVFHFGAVCWPCFTVLIIQAYKIAYEKKIPIICGGWSSGQTRMGDYLGKGSLFESIESGANLFVKPFIHYVETINSPLKHNELLKIRYKINEGIRLFPFYLYFNYDEKKILTTINSKLNWTSPTDTDTCSTNCIINSLGNYIHKKVFGFNRYAIQISDLIRQGLINREKALDLLSKKEDTNIVNSLKKELNLEI